MMKSPIITQDEMIAKLEPRVHPLDPTAKRRATSLGDLTGLNRVGLHYTLIEPGITSTVPHVHLFGDEFLIVISGTATLRMGSEQFPLKAGDFVGLPALGPEHAVINSGKENFVYIVGGDRAAYDIVDYPDLKKRAHLYFKGETRVRDFIDQADIDSK